MIRYFLLLALLPLISYSQTLQFGPNQSSAGHVQAIDDVGLVINNEAISRKQLANEMQAARQSMPKEVLFTGESEQSLLLERVIMQHLLQQMIQRADIVVKEQDVDAAIQRMAAQNGLTVSQMLQRIKKETGMGEKAYHMALSQEIKQRQLQEYYVGNSIRISKSEIEDQLAQIARQQGSKVHLQDLLLPVPNLAPEERGEVIAESLAIISTELEKNSDDLAQAAKSIPNAQFKDLGDVNIGQIPLRFAHALVGIKSGEMVDKPVVDADGMHFLKVVSKTTEGSNGYIVPEAKMAHILIRHNGQNPKEAKMMIDKIYAELQQGADFSEMAKKFSQDPQSAVRGGELGWMSADTVDPRFAKQLQQAPLNQMTPPFESAFGWHILKVYERRLQDRGDEIIQGKIRESLYQSALEDAWQQRLVSERQNAYIDIR